MFARLFGSRASRPLTRFKSRLGDTSGAAAVEFAMVSPLLIATLIGSVEYSMIMYRSIDMRFQANQYARALAAQSMATTDVVTSCTAQYGSTGYSCTATEDTTSYTVSFTYDTSKIPISLFPKPVSLAYSAYQIKYAVQ